VVIAGPSIDGYLAYGLAPDSVDRWVQSGSAPAALQRRRARHRGRRRPHRGCARARDRSRQPRQARPEGPVRVAPTQAATDERLLKPAQRCHPGTQRQVRWANAMLKELVPQTLTN